jgi:hypothetical protein
MRILATAKPNKKYRWINNYKDIEITVRLRNNQIRYYEQHKDGRMVLLSEETAKSLFAPGYSHTDQPFLVGENISFYIVVFRQKKRFTERYYKLKNTLP